MPELPDISAYLSALQRRIVGQTAAASAHRQPVFVAYGLAADCGRCGPPGHGAAPHRQAHCHRPRQRFVAGAAFDDCRHGCIGGPRARSWRAAIIWRRSTFLTVRWCSPRRARSGARRCMWFKGERAADHRSRRHRGIRQRSCDAFHRRDDGGESHAEAGLDRPAISERHRQCLFG